MWAVQRYCESYLWMMASSDLCWVTDYSEIFIPSICKGKSVPVLLTEHHAMKGYWRSEGIAPRILDLATRWRWVVSFTPRSPLYLQVSIG
jgi:hypothetical protein